MPNYVGGDGVLMDPNYYNCELTVVKCQGGKLATPSPVGDNGFNIQGALIKLLNCHAYYWGTG